MNIKVCFAMMLFSTISLINAWSNWAGTQVCSPRQIVYPKTVEELQDQIKAAALSNCKMRVVGAGYSYSDCVCTNGVMVDIRHLKNVLAWDFDKKTVSVQAGITIKELNEKLALNNLALPNQPATANITLGGALATAAHGTGNTGTVSSFVKEIELITACGERIILAPHADPQAFNAALVSLGALGVVYAVTLQCEPLFYLQEHEEIGDVSWLIENYKQLYDQNDFFQCSWNVKNNVVRAKYWNRCTKVDQQSEPVAKKCYEALAWYHINDDDKDLTAEIAVPIHLLPHALDCLKRLIQECWGQACEGAEEVGIRFVRADRNFSLSPAAQQDVAYINISAPFGEKGMHFCKQFEEAMLHYGGRPHWGKINFLNYSKALNVYGSSLINFISVKKRLDPQELFSNAFIDRVCTGAALR